MASRTLENQIDHLYQLPLDQFTSARNALAKTAGGDAARVRGLGKPPVPAWAVNQLYWRKRDVWDALVASAENARRTHQAVLSGRSGDVRAAGKVHDDAVEAALKATLALLSDAGHPATDATRQAIVTTLRALPSEDEPGRLTHVLQPGGFEALAGLSIARGTSRKGAPAVPSRRPAPASTAHAPPPKVDSKALARARTAVASTARELREAEHAAKRGEFEIARAVREEKRAEAAVEDAREALARSKAALETAETEAANARRAREGAEKRAREATHSVTAARGRAEVAEADLKRIENG